MTGTGTWRAAIVTGLSAMVTVVGIDVALHFVTPPKVLREIEDATAEYETADPTILVLGSSHARTFHVLGEVLRERTGGTQRVMAVPVEWGKFDSYAWTLEHRLRPFIEETDASGRLVRPSLKRVLLVTEWWDTVDPDDGQPAFNLPARAWELGDFLADVRENGLTAYNRNYLTNRFTRLWEFSSLIVDRGHEGILMSIQRWLKPPDPDEEQARYRLRVRGWQEMFEEADAKIGAPRQMKAMDRIIDYFLGKNLEVIVVLYPRMPSTISDKARDTSLRHLRELMEARLQGKAVTLVDLTWDNPMKDEDFESDFDHMTRAGALKFTDWVLAGKLKFLAEPAGGRAP